MRFAVLAILASLLAACANHEPPQAEGPWHPLNPGRWDFSSNMLTTPPGE